MKVLELTKRFGAIGVLSVCAFALTFLGSATGHISPPWNRWPAEVDSSQYRASNSHESGPQLVMMFLGKSRCVHSNAPAMIEHVQEAKLRLLSAAKAEGWSFVSQAVALDWSVNAGSEYLAKFGDFDEVSIGYNWANAMAMKYLWSDSATAPAAVPQILVLRRFLSVPDTSDTIASYRISNEQLLARKVGTLSISEWLDQGVSLPQGWDTFDQGKRP